MTLSNERAGKNFRDSTPEVESFLENVARSPRSLLMLDFDGTLAPFQMDRGKAFPYPGIKSVLQEILEIGKTRVVIVSGRDATDLIPLLAVEPHPEVWGLHGLQRVKTDGSIAVSELDEATLKGLAVAVWKVALRSSKTRTTTRFSPGTPGSSHDWEDGPVIPRADTSRPDQRPCIMGSSRPTRSCSAGTWQIVPQMCNSP